MIRITDKSACCGCSACASICPKQCITMQEDGEGFMYPIVHIESCSQCGLCEHICPVLHRNQPVLPITVYAAKNTNASIRKDSTSGGAFTALGETVIHRGGVVFGARFDDHWQVYHDYTETTEGLAAFRGSKYVQSDIKKCYRQTAEFLQAGRLVLFSGTPCQIAGLKRFLIREYENLLTVDIACHGVPSPHIWREYLSSVSPQRPDYVRFRYKDGMINRYLIVEQGGERKCNEPEAENLYIRGFLKDLYLRPSCYACPSRGGRSGSDITIADYWEISRWLPAFDDKRGISLMLIHSKRGAYFMAQLSLEKIETSYEQALAGNPCLENSVIRTEYRDQFWKSYTRIGIQAIYKTCQTMRPSLFRRAVTHLKHLSKHLIYNK